MPVIRHVDCLSTDVAAGLSWPVVHSVACGVSEASMAADTSVSDTPAEKR